MNYIIQKRLEEMPGVAPWEQRLCFLVLLLLVMRLQADCWRALCRLDQRGVMTRLSEDTFSTNALIMVTVYLVMWLPMLVLRTVDVEDHPHYSIYSGVVSYHCYFQQRTTSAFLTALVVSRVGSLHTTVVLGASWTGMMVCGLLAPLVMNEVVWQACASKSWSLQANVYIENRGNYTLLHDTPGVICKTEINENWLHLAVGEWMLTTVLAAIMYWASSTLASSTQPQTYTEKELYNHLTSAERAVHKGVVFLRWLVSCFILVWSLVLRPALSLYLYVSYYKEWTFIQDVPTHVIFLLFAVLIPMEVAALSPEHQDELQEEQPVKHHMMEKWKTGIIENDSDPIWKSDDLLSNQCYDEDVEPLWETPGTLPETGLLDGQHQTGGRTGGEGLEVTKTEQGAAVIRKDAHGVV
ncbi:uncharacterized protein [Procambarus clarkii]|uniref:uncharacterized protein isoform X2 n=1 Tax=Procambarus clarkii TaxID=6728 RepID=UPI001E67519C|nr:uncharacterized protein LOC123754358 isoform X2 [Procambarus clarkii]